MPRQWVKTLAAFNATAQTMEKSHAVVLMWKKSAALPYLEASLYKLTDRTPQYTVHLTVRGLPTYPCQQNRQQDQTTQKLQNQLRTKKEDPTRSNILCSSFTTAREPVERCEISRLQNHSKNMSNGTTNPADMFIKTVKKINHMFHLINFDGFIVFEKSIINKQNSPRRNFRVYMCIYIYICTRRS